MSARGFTLIEMLVVLTIGAILVAAAIPSFTWMIANTRANNGTNTLLAAFELARSEAIRRNTIVSVCRTLDPNAAEPAVACSNAAGGGYAAGDWGSGWVMFEKRGVAAPGVYENGVDFILQREQAVGAPTSTRLIMAGNLGGAAVAYDRFGTAASNAGTFAIDYRDPASATLSNATRCLVVAAVTGRVTIVRPTAGACP